MLGYPATECNPVNVTELRQFFFGPTQPTLGSLCIEAATAASGYS
jgi:hypothetical protein